MDRCTHPTTPNRAPFTISTFGDRHEPFFTEEETEAWLSQLPARIEKLHEQMRVATLVEVAFFIKRLRKDPEINEIVIYGDLYRRNCKIDESLVVMMRVASWVWAGHPFRGLNKSDSVAVFLFLAREHASLFLAGIDYFFDVALEEIRLGHVGITAFYFQYIFQSEKAEGHREILCNVATEFRKRISLHLQGNALPETNRNVFLKIDEVLVGFLKQRDDVKMERENKEI